MMNPYYYPNQQQQFQMPYPQQLAVNRKVDFVQGGRMSAEAYPVGAGEEVILIDMDNPYVYRKARGFDNKLEPLQMFDLIPHVDQPEKVQQVNLDDYVKSEQIEAIVQNKVQSIVQKEVEKRMSEFSFKPTRNKKKVEEDDE